MNKMSPRNRAEAQAVVEQLARRGSEIRLEDEGLKKYGESAERFVKYAWAFGTVVALVTGWTLKVQWDLVQMKQEIVKLTLAADLTKDLRISDNTLTQTIQNSIVANRNERMGEIKSLREDISILKADTPKVAEMWFMQQHGISNKENYFRETGRSAPSKQVSPDEVPTK